MPRQSRDPWRLGALKTLGARLRRLENADQPARTSGPQSRIAGEADINERIDRQLIAEEGRVLAPQAGSRANPRQGD